MKVQEGFVNWLKPFFMAGFKKIIER